ncbi:odorant receptor 4 [Cryptotermes secundus]|uniref:odorant receptor 4 n=1 Tax=Cryptotermes secundus TaxID=105785 RepID=UPI001454DCF7|nr:odorant receptor 4 [Cryptotermes secundus]
MAGWIPRIETITRRLINLTITFHFSYVLMKRLVSTNPRLSYNSWYPFDTSHAVVFELVNASQLLASVVYTIILLGFNGLYATLVCIACSQLEKLRANLLDIRQELDPPAQDSGAETDTEEEGTQVHTSQDVYCRMQQQLSDCVRHHHEILSYVRAMEDTLNPIMTIIFLLDLASLCLGSFSIVTSWGNYVQMSQGIVTYALLLLVLAIYCWFGHELTYQVEKVRDGAWGCDWVGTPVAFQKGIRLIIAAANKEFTLTAGKFVPVAIRTMVNMVNQSVSYFMFLMKVKDSIEHGEVN